MPLPISPLPSGTGGVGTETYRLEDALRAWVKTGSGLADDRVWFADQKVQRPDRSAPNSTFATIRIENVASRGAVDAVETHYDGTNAPGQEIEKRVVGQRTMLVHVQIWGALTVDDAYVPSAIELARRTRQALRLPSVRAALNDAGLAPWDVGAVQNLAALLGTDFEGRAGFDVNFNFVETVSEYIGYIAQVNVTDTRTGTVFTIKES